MANNRMYLRFRPTGDTFYLGKRQVTTGWQGRCSQRPDGNCDIDQFFERCLSHLRVNGYGEIDAFELFFEHEPGWDVKFGGEAGNAEH